MRLLLTSDLHYNNLKSRRSAEQIIDDINRAGSDVLVVIGDVATSHGDALERCLARFTLECPKLFVPGNHELWTDGPDSYQLFREELPRRVRELGWQWLQSQPFVREGVAIVGSIGWYDYAFASPELEIPRRFYEHKVSPGAAAYFPNYAHLLEKSDDVPAHARQIVARWNDGRFVKLHRTDEEFLDELVATLDAQLDEVTRNHSDVRIVVASHHLPFGELLPPARSAQWDFVKAYLGSPRIGEVLLKYPAVQHVVCGHSHFPAEAQVGHIHARTTGCGYRAKSVITIDLD